MQAVKTDFYDSITKKSNFWRFSNSQFIQKMAAELPPGSLLLDLGCGPGEYRILFHNQCYIGVDVGLSFSELDCVADVNRLPFHDQSVDVVLASNLLEHISTPDLLLDEINRVLKPSGKLYVLVPFLIKIHQAPVDFFRYTKYGLRYLLNKAGFTEISFETVGGLFALQGVLLSIMFSRILILLSKKRGGHIAVRFLYPVWSIFYYRVLLPVLHRLDALDDNDDLTLGYMGKFQKADHPTETSASCTLELKRKLSSKWG